VNVYSFCIVQEPFPTVREPKVHRPTVGKSLTLRCQPPYGYPKGVVYWGEYKAGSKLKPIELSERVALDYDGNGLHVGNSHLFVGQNTIHFSRFYATVDISETFMPAYERLEMKWSFGSVDRANLDWLDVAAGTIESNRLQ
jgi:hypothetical protein